MDYKDLPERWKNKIVEYLRKKGETEREELNAYDFSPNQILEIKFEDESYVEFRYPLLINAPEFNEVGVFTEHCGYHIFNLGGIIINIKSILDD
jgi:hypothetical protein